MEGEKAFTRIKDLCLFTPNLRGKITGILVDIAFKAFMGLKMEIPDVNHTLKGYQQSSSWEAVCSVENVIKTISARYLYLHHITTLRYNRTFPHLPFMQNYY
ncbi:hypothetical protein ACTXT7_015540 [Hymenolepis weldensis]